MSPTPFIANNMIPSLHHQKKACSNLSTASFGLLAYIIPSICFFNSFFVAFQKWSTGNMALSHSFFLSAIRCASLFLVIFYCLGSKSLSFERIIQSQPFSQSISFTFAINAILFAKSILTDSSSTTHSVRSLDKSEGH